MAESRRNRRPCLFPEQAPIPLTEQASANASSNLRRGPIMRVVRVLDFSAVATRGARMMPGAFEDVRRWHVACAVPSSARAAIFERGVLLR